MSFLDFGQDAWSQSQLGQVLCQPAWHAPMPADFTIDPQLSLGNAKRGSLEKARPLLSFSKAAFVPRNARLNGV